MPQKPIASSELLAYSEQIFLQKNIDYGTSWRILRLSSITDQIFIKAKLLRNLATDKELPRHRLQEEMAGIINYCILAIIKIEAKENQKEKTLSQNDTIQTQYQTILKNTQALLKKKNQYYADAWQEMRISSIIDIILMKLYRIKKIEDNQGHSEITEAPKAGYQDIINYTFFLAQKIKHT